MFYTALIIINFVFLAAMALLTGPAVMQVLGLH
jgi:hypothetical protein